MPRTAGKPAKTLTDAEKAKLKAEAEKRFIDFGENRTSKVLNSLLALGKVSNRRSFEYTRTQADEIISAVKEGVKALETKFETALASKPGTRQAEKAFSFSSKK